MQQQQDVHIFTGMEKDVSVSKQEANIMYDAHNIRITARTKETALSISNEIGPKEIIIKAEDFKYYPKYRDDNTAPPEIQQELDGTDILIEGTYLASCTLNKYLILITYIQEGVQAIYRITLDSSNTEACRLFKGNIGHTLDSKIDIITSFENTNVQKIYWGDAETAPKVMNISPYSDYKIASYTANSFNFYPDLELQEEVSVKRHEVGGQFAAGVIQWAFTYYNRFLQETNIFYVTPLYYTSLLDRGGSSESVCNNSFTLKIENIDSQFEYLRIYSILRTSLNTTPLCKRVTDIKLTTNSIDTYDTSTTRLTEVTYTDTGTNGDTIEPASLLYKGGQAITAGTLAVKDNTLFLGNVSLQEPQISESIKSIFRLNEISDNGFPLMQEQKKDCYTTKWVSETNEANCKVDYFSPLSLKNNGSFKANEIYRFGIQFQYKTGSWTDPIWIGDSRVTCYPEESYTGSKYIYRKPKLSYSFLKTATINQLLELGYVKARGVMAEPSTLHRIVLSQGVLNPTIYTSTQRGSRNEDGSYTGTLTAQASWLFRPTTYPAAKPWYTTTAHTKGLGVITYNGSVSPFLQYGGYREARENLWSNEIGGYLPEEKKLKVSHDYTTFHSPDILWDESLWQVPLTDYTYFNIGRVHCLKNYSDIDVTLSSAAISSESQGILETHLEGAGNQAWIGQMCFSDSICDDPDGNTDNIAIWADSYPHPVLWPVFMWQMGGSLNNDVTRDGQTSVLQTKKISNYKTSETIIQGGVSPTVGSSPSIALFTSEDLALTKVGNAFYMGNIDTMLATEGTPIFFYSYCPNGTFNNPREWGWTDWVDFGKIGFCNTDYWDSATITDLPNFVMSRTSNILRNKLGIYCWGKYDKDYSDEATGKCVHRIWAILPDTEYTWYAFTDTGNFRGVGDNIYGLTQKQGQIRMRYKTTPHAIINWDAGEHQDIPLFDSSLYFGELRKPYDSTTFYGGTSQDALQALTWIPASEPVTLKQDTKLAIDFIYGDTYYGKFDCLKTYAWSSEDPNQVIDILCFSAESHINGAGRYDRNRGQHSNLNMSPINYNLINTVYSQLDNFFSYKIQPDTNYEMNTFPTEIIWSTEKSAGADIDNWTSITISSTYTMDGSKGEIIKLLTWNDTIYCFQERGIYQVIFNPRVQINTSDNLPIEISNNFKLEGSRSLTDGVGVSNKGSIRPTPTGIYFIDNTTQNLYHMGQNFTDISSKTNMTIYFNSIPIGQWTPNEYTSKIFYEAAYQDVYITTKETALCLNTQLGTFTSYIDYGEVQDIFNIEGRAYCIRNKSTKEQESVCAIYQMWQGVPNYFFEEYKPFDLTYISNGKNAKSDSSVLSKTFTNVTFRGDRWDGDALRMNGEKIERALPVFDYIRAYNEYQDTYKQSLKFTGRRPSNLKEKFRTWHAEIPRHSKKETTVTGTKYIKTRDRIQNPWCKIELGINQDKDSPNTDFIELHDIMTTFFI